VKTLVMFAGAIALAMPVGFLFGLGQALARRVIPTQLITLNMSIDMAKLTEEDDEDEPEDDTQLPPGLRGYNQPRKNSDRLSELNDQMLRALERDYPWPKSK
jgi:hypothetical protein